MNLQVHPGEKFNVSAIVVGGDFGATTGTVMATLHTEHKEELNVYLGFEYPSMHSKLIYDNRKCSDLQYSIVSNITELTVVMTLKQLVLNLKMCLPTLVISVMHTYRKE